MLFALAPDLYAKSYQTREERLCEIAFTQAFKAKKRPQIEKAINSCVPLAKREKAWGEYYVGRLYLTGLGFEKNPKLAAGWFTRAANRNLAEAQAHLGRMIVKGDGVSRDFTAATQLLRAAAKRGDGLGQYELGQRYYTGKGVKQSFLEAYKWFTLSIKSNLKEDNQSLVKLATRKRANSARKLNASQKKAALAWLKEKKLTGIGQIADPGYKSRRKSKSEASK